jgi:hypothetical protein
MVEIHKPAIIGIVEVKPKNYRFSVQECEVSLPGYELFHNLDQDGRGICLHIQGDLKPAPSAIKSDFQEAVFVDCKVSQDETLTVGLVYRSPNSSDDNNEKLNTTMVKIAESKPNHLIILGDFNFPEIDWQEEKCTASANHPATKFLKATRDAFLTQHQTTPTRFRQGQRPTLDDLVLTNRDDIVTDISMAAALGKSDHATLLINLDILPQQAAAQKRPNFRKADYDAVRSFLAGINWESELSNLSTDQAWTYFREKIGEATRKFVPMTKTGGKGRKKWMDAKTLASVRKKHQMFRKWQESRSAKDYAEYAKASNRAKKDCRRAKVKLEETVASQAKRNPKSFWSYVKSKTSTRTGIGELQKEDGTRTKNDKEKAQLLNNFFKSVFTQEPEGDLPDPPEYLFSTELTDIEITVDAVKKRLKQLNPSKAAGPDGIPPLLLSEASDALATPLAIIFQRSLDEGCIPEDWRKANVSPIFKKGSKLSPNNYRPVSLTSVTCKVMEALVREKVLAHLVENRLVCDEQHGFTPGRSCVTQLLDTIDCWTEILDQGGSVDAIYMDFQKAFDSVPHRRLMSKVNALGIRGKVHRWLEDFLARRTQRVVVNGVASEEAPVISGIPQGSVVGPICFVMYINDLPRHAQSTVRIFADDTKLFTQSDNAPARETLQQDLNSLQEWSKDWQLIFHPQKCCVLRLGQCDEEPRYFMEGKDSNGDKCTHALSVTTSERDLGVIVDSKLTFKDHVAQATAKANRTLGVIRRSFDYLNEATFVQLYKSLVRPILEYGHSVWQPHQKGLQSDVEDVQRRATKLIASLKNKPYPERLAALELPSLEHRRMRGDMIDLYKYMHGIYKTSRPQFERHSGRETRGNSLKLAKHHCRLTVRSNFFSERVVSTWNNLPDSVVQAPTINAFKNRLDAHWASLPTIHSPLCYQ